MHQRKSNDRILKFSQSNCDITIDLDNGNGYFYPNPDVVRADGSVVDPFLLATSESLEQIRTVLVNGVLIVSELRGSEIERTTVKDCAEELKLQKGCSYLQRQFAPNGNDFMETQRGYRYFGGEESPIEISYRRR